LQQVKFVRKAADNYFIPGYQRNSGIDVFLMQVAINTTGVIYISPTRDHRPTSKHPPRYIVEMTSSPKYQPNTKIAAPKRGKQHHVSRTAKGWQL
jgi:hypothetical protein